MDWAHFNEWNCCPKLRAEEMTLRARPVRLAATAKSNARIPIVQARFMSYC